MIAIDHPLVGSSIFLKFSTYDICAQFVILENFMRSYMLKLYFLYLISFRRTH